jgi:tRNA dimethylallyltransferase
VQSTGYRALRIGLSLPRPELYRRLDERLDAMIAAGLVEEVRRLLQEGVPAGSAPMLAIGYRQVAAHLAGEVTWEEALRLTRRALRGLVRHQANWFREDDPRIRWVEAGPEAVDRIQAEVETWLGKLDKKPRI